jgi:mannose-6-phosphate isomerase-like protein (cupin superfamily)
MLNINIEKETLENTNYRKVIKTTSNMQLVVMSLAEHEDIPNEIHTDNDQFFRVESGTCKIVTPDDTIILTKDSTTIIPKNTYHQVVNIGNEPLKLYTIYSPPHHQDGLIQKFKPLKGGIQHKKIFKLNMSLRDIM